MGRFSMRALKLPAGSAWRSNGPVCNRQPNNRAILQHSECNGHQLATATLNLGLTLLGRISDKTERITRGKSEVKRPSTLPVIRFAPGGSSAEVALKG